MNSKSIYKICRGGNCGRCEPEAADAGSDNRDDVGSVGGGAPAIHEETAGDDETLEHHWGKTVFGFGGPVAGNPVLEVTVQSRSAAENTNHHTNTCKEAKNGQFVQYAALCEQGEEFPLTYA